MTGGKTKDLWNRNGTNAPALNAALADTNPATALNLYSSTGQNNPATIEKLKANYILSARNQLYGGGVTLDGPLANFGDGTLKAAVGGSFFYLQNNGYQFSSENTVDRSLAQIAGTEGTREVTSLFAEFHADPIDRSEGFVRGLFQNIINGSLLMRSLFGGVALLCLALSVKLSKLLALALGGALIVSNQGVAAEDRGAASVSDLAERIAVIKDHDELERFHYVYGYQQDYMLYYAQADLNARDVQHHYKYGVYSGPDAPRRLWAGRWGGFTGFADMPIYGSLIDHHQAQPVITIAEDRESARARFRTSTDRFFTQVGSGLQNPTHAAEGAEHSVWYENQYIREDDKWKLSSVRVCIYAEGALGSGFADLPVPGRFGVPLDAAEDYWKSRARTSQEVGNWNLLKDVAKNGPDRVETPEEYGCFFAKNQTMVHSVVLPFHFPNPVTGKMVTWENQ